MNAPIRFVPEIGLWALSRGSRTCLWRTHWCKWHCYNHKFYRVNPHLVDIDAQDDMYWRNTTGRVIARDIKAVIGDAKRFRFAVRGEIWVAMLDVGKLCSILSHLWGVTFWIPTRAWHSPEMRHAIEDRILGRDNAKVLASVDPSDDENEVKALRAAGWSTVFVGDNEDSRQLLLVPGGVVEKDTASHVRCTKTWDQAKGHCAVCERGCFSAGRIDVHLRQHR